MPSVYTGRINMHYEETGYGEPLILIMGLGADGSAWEAHANAYKDHFRCILVDNRGAGRTDQPDGPYSTRMMAEDTASLMKALQIDKAHVSGISMGGAIAQELALHFPGRVKSLILNCSWDYCDMYTKRVFESFKSIFAKTDPVTFTRLLQLWIFTPEYHNTHLQDLLDREREGQKHPYPMAIHAFQAQCDACTTHDTRERLPAINVPTLVTVGEKDIFTPTAYSRRISEEIRGSELAVFEGSGHTHHWDNLDKYNRLTLDFLMRQLG